MEFALEAATNIPSVQTMDSREIARITGKRHDNVLRDIETQLGAPGVIQGGLEQYRSNYEVDSSDLRNGSTMRVPGRTYPCYQLPQRECLILASGYDVVLRARIVDRWIELERGLAPRTYAEALRSLADQVEARERAQAALEAARPAIEAQKRLQAAKGSIGIREAAKRVGVGPKAFMDWLIEKRYMFRTGNGEGRALARQEQIDAGRFEMHTGTVQRGSDKQRGREYGQTVLTAAGLAWITERWNAEHTSNTKQQLEMQVTAHSVAGRHRAKNPRKPRTKKTAEPSPENG